MTLKVVVLVGGETTGTRFRPLSMDTPKVLFQLGGIPLLSRIIDNLESQLKGLVEFEVFLVGFFKDPTIFDEYITQQESNYPGLKIKYLSEPTSLGSGGGLYYFRNDIFEEDDCEGLLMIHGDVICEYPFKELIEYYQAEGPSSVIVGIDPHILMKQQRSSLFKNYLWDTVYQQHGTIISRKDTGQIIHYVEKPTSFVEYSDKMYNITINGGIYFFNKNILQLLEQAQQRKRKEGAADLAILPKSTLSLEFDVLKILPTIDRKFHVFKSNSDWLQLKTPVSAILANRFFIKENKVTSSNFINPVSIWSGGLNKSPGSNIGPNVTVGKNVVIGKGVRLVNCIIGDNVTIDDNTLVSNAIISDNVTVGKWCRIEGTLNNSAGTSNGPSDHFRLINNIAVLSHNTVVGNQVFVYNSIVLPNKELESDVQYEIVM